MAGWYARAAEIKAANPGMTAAQIGSALGKSSGAVRAALKRMRDTEEEEKDQEHVTGVTKNVTNERNVTPVKKGRPPKVVEAEHIDMVPLVKAARDTAIEAMKNPAVPWNIRAGTAVQIINGPHGQKLAQDLHEDESKEGTTITLPPEVKEAIVAIRQKSRSDGDED